MSRERQADVVVIGGGPAGSSAATLLARDGYRVKLFEKERFPREHVGESLLPFCYDLFRNLGVLDRLKQTFVRKPGVRFIDRHGRAATSWCFEHVIKDESYLSFQVLRTEFDQILLDNARTHGADVSEATRVKSVDLSEPEAVTVEAEGPDGAENWQARFVIDASGRDAIIGAQRGWRTPRPELDRTALWSHWAGVRLQGGLEEGLSLILYVGEEKKGWIWVFPLGPDRITAGFVCQNAYLRERKRALDGASGDWQQTVLVEELTQAPFVKGLLEGARQLMPVQVNGNYSYEVKHHYGSNYAMVGDARGFIDPIFSSGIFLSIKSSHLVAAAVHDKLAHNRPGVTPQMEQAYAMVDGAYHFVHRMIRLFYNPHAITWAEVGTEGAVHRMHGSAMAAGHYMLSGDFFENHAKYNRFFSLLEDPRGFDRYRRTVMDRPDLNQESCAASWETVFAGMLAADQARNQPA